MQYSQTVQRVMQAAFSYVKKNDRAYLTPEVALLCICDQAEFISAYTACGGNPNALRSDLDDYISGNIDLAGGETPILSSMMEFVLSCAAVQAMNSSKEEIALRHIIYAFFQAQDCYATYFLLDQGVEMTDLLQALSPMEPDDDPEPVPAGPAETLSGSADDLSVLAPCLNDTLKNPKPLIGRESELDRTM